LLTTITAVVGLIGLAVSVALLALQTRAVARQTAISNAIAGASVIKGAMNDLQRVFAVFIGRPELRAYFFDSKPCPSWGRNRVRVQTITDALADVLEVGHLATHLVPASESHEDWTNFCRDMFRLSPTLADLIRRHPQWWPRLSHVLNTCTGHSSPQPLSADRAPQARTPTSFPGLR
jgi:hypothetical protein